MFWCGGVSGRGKSFHSFFVMMLFTFVVYHSHRLIIKNIYNNDIFIVRIY